MDERIRQAVKLDQWIDITTLGRKTGKHRRIEIGIHDIDGDYYITGSPGNHNWYANMVANPQFILHFKESDPMDVRAEATPITNVAEREGIFSKLIKDWGSDTNLDEWLASSKLVRVIIQQSA